MKGIPRRRKPRPFAITATLIHLVQLRLGSPHARHGMASFDSDWDRDAVIAVCRCGAEEWIGGRELAANGPGSRVLPSLYARFSSKNAKNRERRYKRHRWQVARVAEAIREGRIYFPSAGVSSEAS